MQLCLSAVFPPKTQDSYFWTVCHIDQPFIPPPLHNRACNLYLKFKYENIPLKL